MRNFENKEKIVQVSGGLKIVSFIAMIVSGCAVLSGLLIWIIHKGPLLTINQTENPEITFGFAMILNGLSFMYCWNFWSFFSRLKAGHLFDALTVKRLASAGRWKIALWAFSFIDMWLKNKLTFQTQLILFDSLFVGVGILFTAWLLREGQTLEEEQKLTV